MFSLWPECDPRRVCCKWVKRQAERYEVAPLKAPQPRNTNLTLQKPEITAAAGTQRNSAVRKHTARDPIWPLCVALIMVTVGSANAHNRHFVRLVRYSIISKLSEGWSHAGCGLRCRPGTSREVFLAGTHCCRGDLLTQGVVGLCFAGRFSQLISGPAQCLADLCHVMSATCCTKYKPANKNVINPTLILVLPPSNRLGFMQCGHTKSSLMPSRCGHWPWGNVCKNFNLIKMHLEQNGQGVKFPFKSSWLFGLFLLFFQLFFLLFFLSHVWHIWLFGFCWLTLSPSVFPMSLSTLTTCSLSSHPSSLFSFCPPFPTLQTAIASRLELVHVPDYMRTCESGHWRGWVIQILLS